MDTPRADSSLRDGLLEEHMRIEDLLGQMITAIQGEHGESAMRIWGRFRTALLVHLEADDSDLIAALPRAYESNARVLGQEHQHLRSRVSDLNAAGPCDAKHVADLRLLRDILRAHARNDDRLLYGWADAQLGEPQRAAALAALSNRLRALAESGGEQ